MMFNLTSKSRLSWVAMGALIFMISDTLIAVDRFVSTFAGSDVAIMATYYLAQGLICVGVVRYGKEAPG